MFYSPYTDGLQRVNTVAKNNKNMVTSGAVAEVLKNNRNISNQTNSPKWYKICNLSGINKRIVILYISNRVDRGFDKFKVIVCDGSAFTNIVGSTSAISQYTTYFGLDENKNLYLHLGSFSCVTFLLNTLEDVVSEVVSEPNITVTD